MGKVGGRHKSNATRCIVHKRLMVIDLGKVRNLRWCNKFAENTVAS